MNRKPSADQQEVGAGGAPQAGVGPAGQQPRRQQDQDQAGQDGHAQRGQLQRPAPVEQTGIALPRRRPERRQGAPAEEVREVGPVVGRRADVEGIAGDEGGTVRPGQRGDAVEEHRLAQEIEAVGGLAGHAGVPAEVEGELLGERVDRGELCSVGNGVRRTSSRTLSQARTRTRCRAGSAAPSRSSASIAVSTSFRLSRGGRRSGCGRASRPSGAKPCR